MGAPGSGMVPAEQSSADGLLDAFKTIDASEKQKHETVLSYWLSIRGIRELPPLRDLDPLEISDAAGCSVLLELIGGGEDAEVRHLGEQLKPQGDVEKISQAPRQSVLSSIARKLSLVAISRNFLAFEDEYKSDEGSVRCWVTLLPLSSAGAWVDYVYAFVSFGPADAAQPALESVEDEIAPEDTSMAAVVEDDVLELDSPVEEPEPVAEVVEVPEATELPSAPEPESQAVAEKKAGFTFDAGKSTGFYATKAVKVKPTLPEVAAPKAKPQPEPEVAEVEAEVPQAVEEPAPAAIEPDEAPVVEEAALPTIEQEEEQLAVEQTIEPTVDEAVVPVEEEPAAEEQPLVSASVREGSLQSKLTDVRAKADEARQAKLRANVALYEGLAAAYDFALDAEDSPEEYLKLVEAKGLKIQLRAPMRPVVKLAFEGMCDDAMIAQLEAVLAWAIDQALPRGTLAKRIEEEGGIGPILSKAA